MKRIFSLLLLLALLAGAALPVSASEITETETSSSETETTTTTEPETAPSTEPETTAPTVPTGTCGEGLIWELDGSTLTISGTGPMDDFSESPWLDYQDQITTVVLSGRVTSVGAYAFPDFDRITSLDFGSSLTQIGAHAFSYCDGLTRIHLPATFRIFGEESFRGCANLTAIHCEGGFPSFKLNCMWDTRTKIYFPAERPWPVSLIEELENAFQGRIEFLASDGSDPYDPTATEATTEAATQPVTETTAPATEAATAPTEASTAPTETQTVPTVPETTVSAETEATEPFSPSAPNEEPPAKDGFSGVAIGLGIVGVLLTVIIVCALIFRSRRLGRYSR